MAGPEACLNFGLSSVGALKRAFPFVTNTYELSYFDSSTYHIIEVFCFEEWESSCSAYDIRLASITIRLFLSVDMLEEAELVLVMQYYEEKKRSHIEKEAAVSEINDWSPSNLETLTITLYVAAAGKVAPDMRQRLEDDGY
ncbi:pentatricopeptide repeat-containing protein At1g02370, mitochondrial-like [Durio zibethinus]|uniref:Pentatricopeptide repeat-containing protein At1g02370, mitochondrial-like n=1 Tax=Durio zibethinus TaxID=66656 RepID=A0A6P5XI94_DURZI|nr:pentatricopeptide repeat-containing protein At1g02370, mitochondrial-like [Durio zibethinus]